MAAGAELLGKDFVDEQLAGLFPRETKAVMRRMTVRIAANIRKEMRRNAPKDEGTLRKAIISKRRRGRPGLVEAGVFITHGNEAKHDAFYWHMVEFGTKTMQARPFAGPAAESARSTYRSDVADEINRQVIKQLETRAKRQKLRAKR